MKDFFIIVSKILGISILIFIFIALFIFTENYDGTVIFSDDDNFVFTSSFLKIIQIFSLGLFSTLLFLIFQLFLFWFRKYLLAANVINETIIYQKKLERSPPYL
jgi:hypothetical protein